MAKAVGTVLSLAAIVTGNPFIALAAFAVNSYASMDEQRRAMHRARDAYNAGLRDRTEMIRGTVEPRRLILGRQRVGGQMYPIGTAGTNSTTFAFLLLMAGHEVDAIEEVWFNDEKLILDGSGNVTGVVREEDFTINAASATFTVKDAPAAGSVVAVAVYDTTTVTLGVSVSGKSITVSGAHSTGPAGTCKITYQPAVSPFVKTDNLTHAVSMIVTGGSGSVSIPGTFDAASIVASIIIGTGDTRNDGTATTSVSGSTVSITGAPVDGSYSITYQSQATQSYARVRKYLGTSTQAADASLISLFPGRWTSAHQLKGIAYLAIELDYNQDAFPSGVPAVSAVVRGAKVYDPRSATTAWSENPALLVRAAATHALCGRLDASVIDDAAVGTAATACDTSATYAMTSGNETRALYTAGYVARSDQQGMQVINELLISMSGRMAFPGGKLRIKSGYSAPAFTITDDMIAAGQVQTRATLPRAELFNTVHGTFVDPKGKWQAAQFPPVVDSAAVASDGQELAKEIQFGAIAHAGQAQQVATNMMREARSALQTSRTCNLAAYRVEALDTVAVNSSRYGWSGKAFEVIDRQWTLDGGVSFTLRETDASFYTFGSSFGVPTSSFYTTLTSPWIAPAITGLAVDSSATALQDGSIATRTLVSWDPVTDQSVTQSGKVEVQFCEATSLPAGEWPSWPEEGGAASTIIPGLKSQVIYLFRARTRTAIGVRGAWSQTVSHKVASLSANKWAKVYIYQRASSAPALPSVDATFTFATGATTGLNNGWSATIPSGSGAIYVATAVATASGSTQTLPPSSWSTPVVLAQDGANFATVFIYQRSASTPALPSVTTTFTFATNALAGVNNGWAQTIPAGTDPIYISTAAAFAVGATDSIAASDWTAAEVLARDGATGATGATGAPGIVPSIDVIGDNLAHPTGRSLALNGTVVSTGWTARGHTMWVISPATMTVDSGWPVTYDTYGSGTASLVTALASVAAGKIVVLGTQDACECEGSLRQQLTQMGGLASGTWAPARVSHVFIGMPGLGAGQGYEKFTAASAVEVAAFTTATTLVLNGPGAATATLSNEAAVFPADSAGAVTSYTGNTTTMTVTVGGIDDSVNWTFSKVDSSGVSSTLTGQTVTVSSIAGATDSGYVDITAARSGFGSITKRFSISKSKTGAAGATGSTGATGATGAAGSNGQRGSIHASASIAGTTWSDSSANAAISAAGYGSPVTLDQVTLYNGSTYSETRYYNGSAWITYAARVDGNLIVDGTVLAASIAANAVNTVNLNAASVTTAKIAVGAVSAIGVSAHSSTLLYSGAAVSTLTASKDSAPITTAGGNIVAGWQGTVTMSMSASTLLYYVASLDSIQIIDDATSAVVAGKGTDVKSQLVQGQTGYTEGLALLMTFASSSVGAGTYRIRANFSFSTFTSAGVASAVMTTLRATGDFSLNENKV